MKRRQNETDDLKSFATYQNSEFITMENNSYCAEIVSIGDEITSGAILDTNAQWLSVELASLGVRTLYHSTVGDELQPMIDVLKTAFLRSDLVILTGGLGPTEDDLTRRAVADSLGVPLVENAESLEHIRRLFQHRNRIMPDSNKIQSAFPQGSVPIPNPNGTAPGFDIEGDRSRFGGTGTFRVLAFPGVPSEMQEMWRQTSRDALKSSLETSGVARRFVKTKLVHCFGAGESDIESRLPHLIARGHIPKVGITAKQGIITFRIQTEDSDESVCLRQIDETVRTIREKVGEFVFGEDDETLASVVCRELRRSERKVGVLEWGTQGYLSKKIDADCFAGGAIFAVSELFTPYSIKALAAKLFQGTNADYILAVGPYPKRTADQNDSASSDGVPNSDSRLTRSPTSGSVAQNSASDDSDAKTSNADLSNEASVCFFDCSNDRFQESRFIFWEHPSIRDEVYSSRALNLLRVALTRPETATR